MNKSIASLLAAALLTTGPAFAQADTPEIAPEITPEVLEEAATPAAAPLGQEAETDIEIINGIPVNPELKAKILESQEARTVQELLDLSNEVLSQQQDQLAEQDQKIADTSWMQGDPLGHLEGEMTELVGHIDDSVTGDDTQTQGDDVVRKMDALIAMMEKACSACSSCAGGGGAPGNRANGGQPAQDSTLAQGPGGSGDLNAAGNGNNQFGEIDPEQRDAILRAQENNQGFGSEYDALLAEYFQRLASEEALDSPEPVEDGE